MWGVWGLRSGGLRLWQQGFGMTGQVILCTVRRACKKCEGVSSPLSSRIWGIWGSYYNIPKAIFYLLTGDSAEHYKWSGGSFSP